MDGGPGEGRRRGKKKNRQRRKRPKRSRGSQHMEQNKFPDSSVGDDRSILGGRVPRNAERRVLRTDGPPDAFTLFCAYYLGITPSDGYAKPHLEEVARRFGMAPKEVKELLGQHEIDEDTVRKLDFDLVGAQLDIRLAPEGISRTEVARDLWQDYLSAKQAS